MRLIYGLLTLVFLVFTIIIVVISVAGAFEQMHDTMRELLENQSSTYNISVNYTDIDIYEKNETLYDLLNYILIIAFIFAVLGVFMYSKKR